MTIQSYKITNKLVQYCFKCGDFKEFIKIEFNDSDPKIEIYICTFCKAVHKVF